jgi:hypothetical protein
MKTIIFIGLLITVAIVITGVYFLMPNSVNCTNYVLDDAHKITDTSKIPQGWEGLQNPRSPNDNSALSKIVTIQPLAVDCNSFITSSEKSSFLNWHVCIADDKTA